MTFTPTRGPDGYPTTCYCCGRHATGIGIAEPGRQDPRYICEECVLLLSVIKGIRDFNGYERAAVEKAVESVGPFLEQYGTDLSEWEAETAEEFVRAIWLACADGLRSVIRDREVPF